MFTFIPMAMIRCFARSGFSKQNRHFDNCEDILWCSNKNNLWLIWKGLYSNSNTTLVTGQSQIAIISLTEKHSLFLKLNITVWELKKIPRNVVRNQYEKGDNNRHTIRIILIHVARKTCTGVLVYFWEKSDFGVPVLSRYPQERLFCRLQFSIFKLCALLLYLSVLCCIYLFCVVCPVCHRVLVSSVFVHHQEYFVLV